MSTYTHIPRSELELCHLHFPVVYSGLVVGGGATEHLSKSAE